MEYVLILAVIVAAVLVVRHFAKREEAAPVDTNLPGGPSGVRGDTKEK